MEALNRAYVCGAYPTPFETIKERLDRIGIEVVGHCDSARQFHVPKAASVIVLVSDQCSHDVSNKAREAADKLDIPIIAGKFRNWSEFEARAFARGLGQRGFKVNGDDFKVTIGDLDKFKHSEEQPVSAPPAQPELVRTEEKMATPNPQLREKSEKIRAALKQVFENHKDNLETFPDWEAAEEAAGILGYKISNSTASAYRNAMKIKRPPLGFKKHKKGEASKSRPAKPKVQESTTGDATEAEKEFDTIQSMMNEWVARYHVSKLYCAYDNSSWEVNWEQIAVVQKSKKYTK